MTSQGPVSFGRRALRLYGDVRQRGDSPAARPALSA